MSSRIAQGLPTNPRSNVGGRSTPSRQFEAPRPPRPSAIPTNPRPRTPSSQRRPAPDFHERAYRLPQRSNPNEVRNVRRSEESVSTSSSSDSSYWPRGKSSQSSSSTTLQSDKEMEYNDQMQGTPAKESQTSNNYIDTGFVWGRVTEAANVLTHEVSKVWAAGLTANADNDDLEESHLTRVMRAYHLSKARTPSELPEWLFNERERGQGGLLRFDKSDSHGDGSQANLKVPAQQAQQRNRPTYGNSTTPLGTQSRRIQDTQNTRPFVGQAKLSGSDRLKQMRELRRNAPSSAF